LDKADAITWTAHNSGQSTVTITNKKLADEYADTLQGRGLTVAVCPDEDFEEETKE
jgi:ATP-dependent Clp protease adapter protein ClpS